MGQVTHEQVTLMLQLYEMRREPRLREARDWYLASFHPSRMEDLPVIAPPGTRENASMRMVTSYWEMVANIVNRGLIDEEFFFENSGEQWIVWERLKPIAPAYRAGLKNPYAWKNLEEHATRFEAWREKRAPGTNAVYRERLSQALPKPAPAPPGAKTAGGK